MEVSGKLIRQSVGSRWGDAGDIFIFSRKNRAGSHQRAAVAVRRWSDESHSLYYASSPRCGGVRDAKRKEEKRIAAFGADLSRDLADLCSTGLGMNGEEVIGGEIRAEMIKDDNNQSKFLLKNGVPTRIHDRKYQPNSAIIRNDHPQNADFPRYYSRKEKKPFPIPIVELRRAARERIKKSKGMPKGPTPPPRNGMLVKSLVPVAYEVLNARISLINNLKKLMKAVPVQACKHCNEIHVGPTGHPFRSCRGIRAESRRGLHDWTSANLDDVFVPIEAYHLFDRFGRRISHEERFSVPRIPALIELCIQAGVDLPDLETKRRRKPIIRRGKNDIIDANEDDLPDDFDPYAKFRRPILTEIPDSEATPPVGSEQVALLALETFEAWEMVREGTGRLMRKYAVRVCGYCPEVHIGYSGPKTQNCGAYKHQQRNGQHGWQRAVLDDLVPPRYVWHVPDIMLEMQRELRNFYGQAPAVVELCVQGGMEAPEKYKSTMRMDIGIPTNLREAEMVV